jgi:hypothetical protein
MKYSDVLRVAGASKHNRRYPGREDERSRDDLIFPTFVPKFPFEFDRGTKVFTIGSCFARNIEEILRPVGAELPTMSFSAPHKEYSGRSNSLLNEYNIGTISQRIVFALEGRQFPQDTIVRSGSLYSDLLLASGSDVTFERAVHRRADIDGIYAQLARSDLVIITLGLVEAWYDEANALHLNRIPPHDAAVAELDRYQLRRLDVEDSYPLLARAIGALRDCSIKVILTVSPVPLSFTFSGQDCVVANEFSKSVLRVCADRIERHFDNVEYFPSYEIVRSGGLSSYGDDQVHVKDAIVRRVIDHLMDSHAAQSVMAERARN